MIALQKLLNKKLNMYDNGVSMEIIKLKDYMETAEKKKRVLNELNIKIRYNIGLLMTYIKENFISEPDPSFNFQHYQFVEFENNIYKDLINNSEKLKTICLLLLFNTRNFHIRNKRTYVDWLDDKISSLAYLFNVVYS